MGQHGTIGILGGMGPAATVEFFRRLVAATRADSDQEHLRIIIDNDPNVPSRTDAILRGGPSPEPALAAMAKGLEASGADLLAMPCNTAHHYFDAIQRAVEIPVLDMIAETASEVSVQSVGLLATTATVHLRLFERRLASRGVELAVPGDDDQKLVMRAIEQIKAGISVEAVGAGLVPVVEALGRAGAKAVIAGCTEISLVAGSGMPLLWIDALDCLVDAAIRAATGIVRRQEVA